MFALFEYLKFRQIEPHYSCCMFSEAVEKILVMWVAELWRNISTGPQNWPSVPLSTDLGFWSLNMVALERLLWCKTKTKAWGMATPSKSSGIHMADKQQSRFSLSTVPSDYPSLLQLCWG